MISETIIKRIEENSGHWFANDNIFEFLKDGELDLLQLEVEKNVETLLRSLIIDTRDHNTQETSRRVAKMYIRELLSGRYEQMPKITDFPNYKHLDEIYTLGPVSWKSVCSHHLLEINGQCWIGIRPGERVIGISKLARITGWIARRPHIQEEATIILADHLEKILEPIGLGVVIKATHDCMSFRGVEEEDSTMVTSVMRGSFLENISTKQEFFGLIKTQGF